MEHHEELYWQGTVQDSYACMCTCNLYANQAIRYINARCAF